VQIEPRFCIAAKVPRQAQSAVNGWAWLNDFELASTLCHEGVILCFSFVNKSIMIY
jgi:hypothetical protein